MANLHKEYFQFKRNIEIPQKDIDTLFTNRNVLREKIRKYFREEKKDELQPKFTGQGSKYMGTLNKPIPVEGENGKAIYKYDLDDGIYFLENEGEDNRRAIDTWHNWVYNAVEDHTDTPPQKKKSCIRVLYADGHHIDLPIYYKDGDVPELAHKGKGWIDSDPKEFIDWFKEQTKGKMQLVRIVRYLKAWKNYKEINNSNLIFPSGFSLTILAVNNYCSDDRDDIAFRDTIKKIKDALDIKFECLRPTTPKNEDVFADFSETRKTNFLNALDSFIKDCDKAIDEKNFKNASEALRKHFGDRFPLGEDEDEEEKTTRLASAIASSYVKPKPYAKFKY